MQETPMAKKETIPQYDVDKITLQLIESVLNLAAQTAQLQLSEESAETVYAITDGLAQRFKVDTRVYEVEAEEDETRSITVYKGKVREGSPKTTNSAPVINGNVFPFPFRVIDGDKPQNDNDD